MKRHRDRRVRAMCFAGFFVAAVSTGCHEYTVEVQLEPDGSGSRLVSLRSDDVYDATSTPSQSEFRRLYGMDEARGWLFVPEVDRQSKKDQDNATVFRRTDKIDNPTHWYRQSGDIHIRGALEPNGFSGVEFVNEIAVEVGGDAKSGTLTYRETFVWHELKEVLIGLLVERFGEAMLEAYPKLDDEDRSELEGLMAGHLAMSLPGLIDMDEDTDAVISSITSYAHRIVRKQHPDATDTEVADIARAVITVSDDALERRIERLLPGVDQSIFLGIKVYVRVPGEIVDTNADETTDNVAAWEIDVLDATVRPIELFVRVRVSR